MTRTKWRIAEQGAFDHIPSQEGEQSPCGPDATRPCVVCAAFETPVDGEGWHAWAERLGAREGKTRGRPAL